MGPTEMHAVVLSALEENGRSHTDHLRQLAGLEDHGQALEDFEATLGTLSEAGLAVAEGTEDDGPWRITLQGVEYLATIRA
jgi:hypothetical protein